MQGSRRKGQGVETGVGDEAEQQTRLRSWGPESCCKGFKDQVCSFKAFTPLCTYENMRSSLYP